MVGEGRACRWGDDKPIIVGDFQKALDSSYNVKYFRTYRESARRQLMSAVCRPVERRWYQVWLQLPETERPADPHDLIPAGDNAPGEIDEHVTLIWRDPDGTFTKSLEIWEGLNATQAWAQLERILFDHSFQSAR